MLKRKRTSITPVEYVISLFGSASKLARALGLTRQAVHGWTLTNGRIPSNKQIEVLQAAKRLGIGIDLSRMVG